MARIFKGETLNEGGQLELATSRTSLGLGGTDPLKLDDPAAIDKIERKRMETLNSISMYKKLSSHFSEKLANMMEAGQSL